MDIFFPKPVKRARFKTRLNRFVSSFTDDSGCLLFAHSPNTGSMAGLLVENAPALLWDSQNPARKYPLSWKAIQIGTIWVGIDTALPNALTATLLERGPLGPLPHFDRVEREKKSGEHSRIDLLAWEGEHPWYIEVKNVTLQVDGVARFPDAVTKRGLKHLHELQRLRREGMGAAMVYVIQRRDCDRFTAAGEIDPAYARTLEQAWREGLIVLPLLCEVTPAGVRFLRILEYHPELAKV